VAQERQVKKVRNSLTQFSQNLVQRRTGVLSLDSNRASTCSFPWCSDADVTWLDCWVVTYWRRDVFEPVHALSRDPFPWCLGILLAKGRWERNASQIAISPHMGEVPQQMKEAQTTVWSSREATNIHFNLFNFYRRSGEVTELISPNQQIKQKVHADHSES